MRKLCFRQAVLIWLSALVVGLSVSSCDVHEFPDIPEKRPYKVQLLFEFENMFDWKMLHDEVAPGTTRGEVMDGMMRCVIRLYPRTPNFRTLPMCLQEFILFGTVYDIYGCEYMLDLIPGDYNMMVWADFVNPYTSDRSFFYNVDDFSDIMLSAHVGSTDYRDAFRGYKEVSVSSGIEDCGIQTIIVNMERPLAKFEFVSNDIKEFIDKEYLAMVKEHGMQVPDNPYTRFDFSKYKVVFHYSGFMPDTYSMVTDKPIDSSTGRSFESTLSRITEEEVSLGFDYVFVNGKSSSVSVQVGIYNEKQEVLSMSNPVSVPLLRGHHTIVRGSYLMQNSSDGLIINPEFDGEHNVVIP